MQLRTEFLLHTERLITQVMHLPVIRGEVKILDKVDLGEVDIQSALVTRLKLCIEGVAVLRAFHVPNADEVVGRALRRVIGAFGIGGIVVCANRHSGNEGGE